MMRSTLTALVVSAWAVTLTGCASTGSGACKKSACGFKNGSKEFTHFGKPMSMPAEKTVCIEDVLDDPKAYNGRMIRVCGRVEAVCAHRGCWMKLTGSPGRDTVFVKFTCPVKGRLIPTEAVDCQAVVEGTFTVSTIPEAEARHYAEDAGKSADEIARIVGPQHQLRLQSPAAMIRGV